MGATRPNQKVIDSIIRNAKTPQEAEKALKQYYSDLECWAAMNGDFQREISRVFYTAQDESDIPKEHCKSYLDDIVKEQDANRTNKHKTHDYKGRIIK